jgi:hypothetical protein
MAISGSVISGTEFAWAELARATTNPSRRPMSSNSHRRMLDVVARAKRTASTPQSLIPPHHDRLRSELSDCTPPTTSLCRRGGNLARTLWPKAAEVLMEAQSEVALADADRTFKACVWRVDQPKYTSTPSPTHLAMKPSNRVLSSQLARPAFDERLLTLYLLALLVQARTRAALSSDTNGSDRARQR